MHIVDHINLVVILPQIKVTYRGNIQSLLSLNGSLETLTAGTDRIEAFTILAETSRTPGEQESIPFGCFGTQVFPTLSDSQPVYPLYAAKRPCSQWTERNIERLLVEHGFTKSKPVTQKNER